MVVHAWTFSVPGPETCWCGVMACLTRLRPAPRRPSRWSSPRHRAYAPRATPVQARRKTRTRSRRALDSRSLGGAPLGGALGGAPPCGTLGGAPPCGALGAVLACGALRVGGFGSGGCVSPIPPTKDRERSPRRVRSARSAPQSRAAVTGASTFSGPLGVVAASWAGPITCNEVPSTISPVIRVDCGTAEFDGAKAAAASMPAGATRPPIGLAARATESVETTP
jgi:hypothetical protein